MYRTIHKTLLITAATAGIPMLTFAAESNTTSKPLNLMLIGLVSLIVVLLFAIGVIGNVLRQLAYVYVEKMRKEKTRDHITKAVLLFMLISMPSSYALAQDAAQQATAPAYISGMAAGDYYLLIGVLALEMLVIITMLIIMNSMVRALYKKPGTAAAARAIIRKPFWDRFNKAVAIEKEADIMLDHDYDGIKELDNSLPPWWKYGFYMTIVIGVLYLYYYHAGGNGPSSYQEYVAEVEKGEREKAEYLAHAANNVDENTVVMLDATGIASGQNIFQSTCAACHAKDGGGGVGPNLTDNYWLHGGSIADVFKSIKYGWPDKGMKSWKDDFSPKQIAELASYVKSLKGSQPAAPKEKQGAEYIEGEAVSTDSTKTIAAN